MSTSPASSRPDGPTGLQDRARRIRQWLSRPWTRLRGSRREREPGPRRRSWRRVLAWTVGVILVIVTAVAMFLAWFDWDKARGPIARFASARLHRTVAIDGHLRVHLLTWTPTATVEGLRISQPAWAGSGQMVTLKGATASVRLLPLLRGQVILPLVQLDGPDVRLIRDIQGRANWKFSDGPDKGPAKLPPIQTFVINDGRLRYADAKAKLVVSGAVNAREQRSGAYDQGFRMNGDGSINNEPFRLVVTGGPMINIDPNRPYPFNLDIRAGSTRATGQGSITKPFDFGRISAAVHVKGPDMADLYRLTRITLPNTPPYDLKAQMTRDGSTFSLSRIGGTVGDSDLGGGVRVETRAGRPFVRADLVSNRLQLDDLMAVLGGAPSIKRGHIASPQQIAIAKRLEADQRLLPDATLQIDRLRTMDAVLRYRALSVQSPVIPVRQASLDLKLDHGVLDLNPFRFKLAFGEASGKARIDGRGPVPVTDFDAVLTGVSIQQFIKTTGTPPIEGTVSARARLRGEGASVRAAAAHANGTIAVIAPHGQIRRAFAELMGINVGRGLYLLLSKDEKQTDLRCAAASFKVTEGIARAETMVVDTSVVLTRGSGTIDLRNETLDLRFEGQSKRLRLLRLWAPITITGPLRHPRPGVETGRALAQAGAGLAIGAVLSPLAAMIPFVTGGGAKDADCGGLIATAAAKGAPVTAADRAATR